VFWTNSLHLTNFVKQRLVLEQFNAIRTSRFTSEIMAAVPIFSGPVTSAGNQACLGDSEPATDGQRLDKGHVQLLVNFLKAAQAVQCTSSATVHDLSASAAGTPHEEEGASRAKASKLEYKTVNET